MKFTTWLKLATPAQKKRAIRARKKFAAHWEQQAARTLDRNTVSRARYDATARGITLGELLLRQVENGQPVPIGCES